MYKWYFGDGSTKETDDSKLFGYEYKAAGIYTLTIFGYNEVSNATSHVVITVQDQITGLKFIGKNNPMVPNTNCSFQWNIDKGLSLINHIQINSDNAACKLNHFQVKIETQMN